LKISRLDLDGVGSPGALVARILEVEPDLPIPVPVEELCERFDIVAIDELETDGFEAALLTDAGKGHGAILVARGRSRQRRRFSISHELGHFLIPTHMPSAEGRFLCSREDMARLSMREQSRRARMEVEANRFAAQLLMPVPILRAELRRRAPELKEVVRLAGLFDVSKEAMARAYAEFTREALALLVVREGRVVRRYSSKAFPWLAVSPGQLAPPASIVHAAGLPERTPSLVEECEPELWFDEPHVRCVAALTEQVMHLQGGYALQLLHAEIADQEEHGDGGDRSGWARF
jgi:hypothetical protein